MSGFAMRPSLRRLALLVPLLLGTVSGCGGSNVDPYPVTLTYPLRTDLIVKSPPDADAPALDDPGQLDHWVAAIDTKGGKTLDPNRVPANLRQELQRELEKVFGRPVKPTVNPTDEDQKTQAVNLQLTDDLLAEGSKNYRRHCLHCHGIPGDGRGPTGPWLNPHPRDYRQGIFKFTSSKGDAPERKPRRDDLLRTLRRGVDGTSMPSFGLESPDVLNSLVSYVMHLSIRGEVEMKVLDAIIGGGNSTDKLVDQSIAGEIDDQLGKSLKGWKTSTDSEPNTPETYAYTDQDLQDSISRGYTAFTDEKRLNCVKCHIDFGRQSPLKYDSWGTVVRPRDLTLNIYRGGRRPIDIFWRIKGGIPGALMPGNTTKHDAKTDEAWDVVNFVLALPYPNMLPPEIREKVYPEPKKGHGAEKHASAN
jgi:mono/diheme cytochrome c family protein